MLPILQIVCFNPNGVFYSSQEPNSGTVKKDACIGSGSKFELYLDPRYYVELINAIYTILFCNMWPGAMKHVCFISDNYRF